MKKTSRHTLLHMHTIKDTHIMYGSWDMEDDGQKQNFYHFGPFFAFCPPPPNNPKSFKKKKKHLEISSYYISVPKIMTICYIVCEIWHVTDVIFIFHFGLFSALLAPNNKKKIHFFLNEKNAWRYLSNCKNCHHTRVMHLRIHLRTAVRSRTISDNWKPFKNDEKYFLFHVKNYFCFWDVFFSLTFHYAEKRLNRKALPQIQQ